MKKAQHFSSHLPALIHTLAKTTGDVLELGTGLFSTPFLHYLCVPKKRLLVSVYNNQKYYESVLCFEHEYHKIIYTEDWAIPDLVRQWSVVFIDHGPPEQRRVDLLRFADLATYIVVHDTNGRQDTHYHFSTAWQDFKYVYTYNKFFPATTIVSNSMEIGDVD